MIVGIVLNAFIALQQVHYHFWVQCSIVRKRRHGVAGRKRRVQRKNYFVSLYATGLPSSALDGQMARSSIVKQWKINYVFINISFYLRVNKIDRRDCVTRCYFIALGTLVNSEGPQIHSIQFSMFA